MKKALFFAIVAVFIYKNGLKKDKIYNPYEQDYSYGEDDYHKGIKTLSARYNIPQEEVEKIIAEHGFEKAMFGIIFVGETSRPIKELINYAKKNKKPQNVCGK